MLVTRVAHHVHVQHSNWGFCFHPAGRFPFAVCCLMDQVQRTHLHSGGQFTRHRRQVGRWKGESHYLLLPQLQGIAPSVFKKWFHFSEVSTFTSSVLAGLHGSVDPPVVSFGLSVTPVYCASLFKGRLPQCTLWFCLQEDLITIFSSTKAPTTLRCWPTISLRYDTLR